MTNGKVALPEGIAVRRASLQLVLEGTGLHVFDQKEGARAELDARAAVLVSVNDAWQQASHDDSAEHVQ
jgi:hypothetical protein